MNPDHQRRTGAPDRARILLIGAGAHAAHVYLPWITAHPGEVELVGVVDLDSAGESVRRRLGNGVLGKVPRVLVPAGTGLGGHLGREVATALDALGPVDGVVVSTEPLAHGAYARWALARGYSVLSDKPIVLRENMSSSSSAALAVRAEYDELRAAHSRGRTINPRCSLTVSTHRRYHPGFALVRAAIAEIAADTGCPVTSITGELADGEWRLPHELLHQTYHPLNQGYGALSHSGYHVIDQFCLFARAGQVADAPDSVTAYASAVRPHDVVAQMPTDQLRQMFPGAAFDHHLLAADVIARLPHPLGEHDVSAIVNLRREGAIRTMGKLSVTHQSVSSRAWADSAGRDLYRGNGRVRQEMWAIHQGPLQTIRIISAQADKADADRADDWHRMGGKEHFDVHVFRNANLVPGWERLRSYQVDDLVDGLRDSAHGGHQDHAKARMIADFVRATITADGGAGSSDLADHSTSHAVWCALNESLARQVEGYPGEVTRSLSGEWESLPTDDRATTRAAAG